VGHTAGHDPDRSRGVTQKTVLYCIVALVFIAAIGATAFIWAGGSENMVTMFVGFVGTIIMSLLALLRSEAATGQAAVATQKASDAQVTARQAVVETQKGNREVEQLKREVRETLAVVKDGNGGKGP
jgi:uncharacterized membrane protein YgaE (UPF0421/DUF939 family)